MKHSEPNRRMAIVRYRDVFEVALERESRAFAEAGFDVDIFMLTGKGRAPNTTQTEYATVHRLPGMKDRGSQSEYVVNYGSFLLRVTRALLAEHRRRPFAVVQVNTMPDFLAFCTVPLRFMGVKTSVFMKEPTPELGFTLYGSTKMERLLKAIEWLTLRYADVAFAVTPEQRELYLQRGAPEDRLHVVLNCPDQSSIVNPDIVPRRDPERFVLICHGTIEHRWGFDMMIEAVDMVRERIPNVELRLTGAGDYLDDVLAKVERLDLGDHVTYLGWLDFDELLAEVAGADGGIAAQLSSPYSNLVHTQKMYEFIMLGVPCLVSRLRSVSTMFDEDELMFFAPGDASSLAEAIIKLHDTPGLADSLVTRARERLESGYQWEDQKVVLVNETLSLLD